MHRDVKRALILWPAAASATITAAAWLAQVGVDFGGPVTHASAYFPSLAMQDLAVHPHRDTAVPMTGRTVSDRDPSPVLRAEAQARSERGARGMQLPERVAEVYGAPTETIAAPIRNQQREMAGWVDHAAEESDSAGGVTLDLQPPDQLAPHQRTFSRSQPDFPSVFEADGFKWIPPSVLPKSTRILAKPAPKQPIETKSELNQPNSDREDSIDDATFPAISEIEYSAPPEPTSPSQLELSLPASPVVEDADERSVDDEPDVTNVPGKPQISPPKTKPALAGWPNPLQLINQLKPLMADSQSARAGWASEVAATLQELRELPRLGDPVAGELLDRLDLLATRGIHQAERVTDRQRQIEWLLACHSVARRIAVWKPVWQLGQSKWMVTDETIDSPLPSEDNPAVTLHVTIAQLRHDIERTGDRAAWSEFFLLEDVEQAAKQANSRDRTVLAQRVLSRLQWHGLDQEQLRWLDRESVQQFASVIRPWARGAVDYANLLRQLERQESDSIDLAAIDIANSVQSLRFADSPSVADVGDAINTYYRNANIRLALSQPMLQRMMPTIEPQTVPVRTTVLGSRVRGNSRIESELRLQLYPSPDRWVFDLQAIGSVNTQSTGFNSGVAVRTRANANFRAAAPIEITSDNIRIQDPDVEVNGRTRLRSIRSDYDGWPLVGSLVRNIAKNRFESDQPRSNRVATRRIQSTVGEQFEQRLNDRVDQSTKQLGEMVLGPLGRLQLDPKVMDMQTTDSRLVARYRLAGDWQLGAFTPRPRAPRSSLMSIQVHQSALNNTLEQLIPRDRPSTIAEIVNRSAETFSQREIDLPDDIPEDVTVQFAQTRPITVEIEDGRLWVTLRVVRLRGKDRMDLTRFIVRAKYKPVIEGMNATLVRDGHLRISGPGMSMRERLPIRAIFNKVLSPNRPFNVTLPQVVEHPAMQGLAVSQLELREGWIALAISQEKAPRVALVSEN